MTTNGEAGRPGPATRHRRLAAPVAAAVAPAGACIGGVVVLSGLFGPLTREGPGSAISIAATADLLLGGAVEAWAPRWVGLLLYLPPVLAAGAAIAVGLAGWTARVLGCLLAALGTASLLGAGWAVGRGLPFAGGAGHRRMLWGSLVLLGAAAWGAVADPPRRT